MRKDGEITEIQRHIVIRQAVIDFYVSLLSQNLQNSIIKLSLEAVAEHINEPLEKWHDIHPNEDYVITPTTAEELKDIIEEVDLTTIQVTPYCKMFKGVKINRNVLTMEFTDHYFYLLMQSCKKSIQDNNND